MLSSLLNNPPLLIESDVTWAEMLTVEEMF